MLTSELDYALPESLIAQRPAEPRDASRLMVVDATGKITHHVFRDLPRFLGPGDALVLNETKVLPARLLAADRAAERSSCSCCATWAVHGRRSSARASA